MTAISAFAKKEDITDKRNVVVKPDPFTAFGATGPRADN